MNVLLVVTGLPNEKSPARSVFNLRYASDLARRGINVKILYLRAVRLSGNGLKERNYHGIKCMEVYTYIPKFNSLFSRRFLAFIFNFFLGKSKFSTYLEDIDVVHAVSGGSIEGAYLLASKFRLPLISQFIGSDVNLDLFDHLRGPYFKLGLEYSSYLCFNSRSLKDVFFSYVKIKHEADVLYRGINLSEFKFYFNRLNTVNILFLGGFPNMGNLKGGRTLLDALVLLSRYELPVNIEVVIGGPNANKYNSMGNDIEHNRISIEFIGPVGKEVVKKKLYESHIVLIPSLAEGLPNVLYEAMATGNMVIATNVGGIPEILVPGVTGFLIPPDDPMALSDSILRSIGDLKFIERCAIEGRARVEKLDYNSFIDGYLDLYDKSL